MTDLSTRHALTPSSLKTYLRERGIAPFSDLVHRFDAPPAAVSAVLSFWTGRGRVRPIVLETPAHCSTGCDSCGSPPTDNRCAAANDRPALHDLYEWIDPESPPLDLDALAVYHHTHS